MKRRAVVSWVLVVLWACFIFFMSAHTGNQMDTGILGQLKQFLANVLNAAFGYHDDPVSPLGHFLEYTVFGVLLANALRHHMSPSRACLIAIACASAYGITDEFHQLFVPERACDPADWLTDTCGAALGAALVYVTMRARGAKSRKRDARTGR